MAKDKTLRTPILLIIILIAIVALALGIWLQSDIHKSKKPLAIKNGTVLARPVPLKPFTLTSDEGKPFTNNSLKGHWSLLFFGFTSCPMICPTTLSELNKAYDTLRLNKKKPPQIVFISVDPKRDSNSRIHNYLANFNSHFIGVTGDASQIDKLTKTVGIAYLKSKKSGEKNYQIEHSGAILVINPKGEWVALLRAPHSGDAIAKDFLRIVR